MSDPSNYKIEYWLSSPEIASLAYSEYWNNEEEERAKEWYVLEGDFAKMEMYLEETGLVKQLNQCLAFLEANWKWTLRGVGADLACGTLWAVPYLLKDEEVERLYCVEYSRHRLLKIGPCVLDYYKVSPDKVVLCLGNFYDLKLPNCSLDFVFLAESFHHADRPLELLSEIRRVLKPQGAVIIIGEHVRTIADTAKHLAKFSISHLFPLRLQQVLFGRAFNVRTPLPTGQLAADPILGDHYYSDREYKRMFRHLGVEHFPIRTPGSELQSYVLRRPT
jgi:SAM-dependent methyltransferase